MPGTLFVVATPIGNLEDVTARALRVLRTVALIAAEDTRRTARLLAHYGITTPTTSLHEHNETQKSAPILERLRRDEDVAVVSDAGTPTVSDPGQRLVRAAIDAGFRVEPVPGPSAVMAALAGSGLTGDCFSFLGFPPTRSSDRKEWLDRLRAVTGLAVFFEAPHRIRATLADLARVLGPDRRIVVAREVTKAHEEWVRGPISQIVDRLRDPIGEYTVVVDIGQTTEIDRPKVPAALDWLYEIGQITKSQGVSRRRAINILARRTGLPPNDVYAAVERAKKSVE